MEEINGTIVPLAPTHGDNAEKKDGDVDEQLPEGPTDSHVLSQVEQEEKGLSQKAGVTSSITDIGWNQNEVYSDEPLVAGLSNEDLWMLIRRFDKQVYNVKAVPHAPLQKLDLTRADDDEFSPDKLRATLERFYTTVFVCLTSFVKHVARLRSWKEPRRTAIFCGVYFASWLLDLLVPVAFGTMIALILYPPCRLQLFPPAPIALVDKDTGGVQKPKAGVLGSHDSITGAPEKFKGEAAEQEASNLVASVASVAVGSAAGKHDQGVPEDAPLEGTVPDAMEIVANTADAQTAAHGKEPSNAHDKTRQPMKETVMETANMAMDVVSNITDIFEKFQNALSPTPPFPRLIAQMRLAASLAPIGLMLTFTPTYVLMKGMGFTFGFAFFGDPVIRRGIALLNRKFPHWEKILQIQNFLLKGVPTNAQLTLTLLRIGEHNACPLPPPPVSHDKAPSRPASLHHEELSLGATDEEITEAAVADPHHRSSPSPTFQEGAHKKNLASRVLGFFRGATATGVESKRGMDRVRALAGSHYARNRLGVLRRKGKTITPLGPTEFDARYNGKRGAVVIDSTKEPPLLYFTTDVLQGGNPRLEDRKAGSVLFTLPVTDICEMKKLGGMGWKGKLVVGWAIGSKEVVDGLLIVGMSPHQSYQLTAMGTRNQLFNRLIAIDGQVWR